MNAAINSVLGTLFLILAFATVFLMYRLWGYPFDKLARKSAAPPGLMRLHRVMGVAYLLIYIVLMTQMVPRLWTYQVEFPARTVAHIFFGITIGVILLVKLSILRFFRHFEEWMPVLGTLLLLCTIMLTTLSIPFAVREQVLSSQALGGHAASQENLARLVTLLPNAGFPDGTNLENLATQNALREGRSVLVTQCTVCHDMRTVLLRPRTPSDWWQTVKRMMDKPNPSGIITERQSQTVTAYLIAITPDLQVSAQEKRQAQTATTTTSSGDPKALFEKTCSQCHAANLTDAHDFKTDPVNALVQRMVTNGLKASDADLETIRQYITATFVK